MSCSPDAIKDLLFGALEAAEASRVKEHMQQCAGCREEFDRLQFTQTALHALRDEEPPRRIAFVSDRVFEPRWWQRLWHSGPQLGFASAALLAAAITIHAFVRPAPEVAAVPDPAAIEARIMAEVSRRIEPAVRAAVAEAEARQKEKADEILAAARREFQAQREADRLMLSTLAEEFTLLQKRYNVLQLASADLGVLR
ncbi:MAG TPA: zf-HC2 domain-containing protein [Bryobacteraceae bacterium]|nr:zf-HC2 domain-containing protein [Bryobacteraceae bacterium]